MGTDATLNKIKHNFNGNISGAIYAAYTLKIWIEGAEILIFPMEIAQRSFFSKIALPRLTATRRKVIPWIYSCFNFYENVVIWYQVWLQICSFQQSVKEFFFLVILL